MDTINETGENDDDEDGSAEVSDEEDNIVLFVESKYCTICHLE